MGRGAMAPGARHLLVVALACALLVQCPLGGAAKPRARTVSVRAANLKHPAHTRATAKVSCPPSGRCTRAADQAKCATLLPSQDLSIGEMQDLLSKKGLQCDACVTKKDYVRRVTSAFAAGAVESCQCRRARQRTAVGHSLAGGARGTVRQCPGIAGEFTGM